MKSIVFTLVAMVAACPVQAQDNGLIRVRAGDDVLKVIPFDKRFQYDPFQGGYAFYSNGRSSATFKFNYDFLLGEMRIISKTNDTLYVVNDDALKYVFIGRDIFYHDFRRGYFQLLAEAHSVRLAIQQVLKKKRRETSMSNGYSRFVDYTSAVSTPWGSDDILLENRRTYYLIDETDFVRKSNKSNFLRAFDKYQEPIALYLRENDINFRKEGDLKKLFQFCSRLH